MLLHWESSLSSSSSMARSIRSRTLGGNFESCLSASRETSTRKSMVYGAPRFRLTALELCLAAAHDFRLLGRQRVVGMDSALRLDQHAVFLLGERHQVPGPKIERFEDLARDHHLAALTDSTASLFGLGCLHDK